MIVLSLSWLLALTGCATKYDALPTPEKVDLPRFMGLWFVVGYTPILVDKEAYNGVEHYYLADNGKIRTTYQFRDGGFDGKLKTYTPVGKVYDTETNAEWRMQFVWPFNAQYIILYLADDYSRTIIAHPNRKYAWIMQREPTISDSKYQEMIEKLVAEGFDPAVIKRLPQDWSNDQERLAKIREIGATSPLAE